MQQTSRAPASASASTAGPTSGPRPNSDRTTASDRAPGSAPAASAPVALAEPASVEEAVMVTMMSLGRRMRQRQAGDEIDLSALFILKILRGCGPMRLSALAATLELDASTVSRHVRHLEDRGLLERTSDPDDGRASMVAVTRRGARCLQKHAAGRRALIGQLLEDWTDDDREQLRCLLARVNRDLTTSTTENP